MPLNIVVFERDRRPMAEVTLNRSLRAEKKHRGSDEKVLAFLSLKGDAANLLDMLQSSEGLMLEIDKILNAVFQVGRTMPIPNLRIVK